VRGTAGDRWSRALLAQAPLLGAQCLGPAETAARIQTIATTNDAAIDAALTRLDRGRARTVVAIPPRSREVSAPVSLTTLRSTPAHVERRVARGQGTRVVLVAATYSYDVCTQPNLPPDEFRFVRTRAGRIIPIRVLFDDRPEPVASCECTGGCGAAMGPRTIAREYELPAAALRDVGPIETVRAPRVVAQRPVCTGMG
jgi:hypothetical protein